MTEAGLILVGLLLVAGGIDNMPVTVLHVQLPAPGALAVQVVFTLAGVAVLLRGLDRLWGHEVRSASRSLGAVALTHWRRWRAASPPKAIAGLQPGVPPARNPLFRDREGELTRLRARLVAEQRIDLSGLGGVGKSQLALEYLHRYRAADQNAYRDGVFWLRGESTATLSSDIAALAWLPELMLNERELREQEQVSEAVISWLRARCHWLLVVDNLDEAALPALDRLLAPGLTGHVLATSRVPIWDPEPLAVQPMSPLVAAAFLLERSGQTDAEAAATVVEQLGGLPLALVQAAAYVRSSGRELASYAELLRDRFEELLERGKPADYPSTVAATWELSFDRISHEQPAANALLRLCAFMAPDDVPIGVLLQPDRGVPHELEEAASDQISLDAAIAELRRYALVERRGDGLLIHRLVQVVVRGSLKDDERQRWLGATIRLLEEVFPQDVEDPGRWPLCARLTPHVQVAADLVAARTVEPRAMSWLLDRVATYLQARGELQLATPHSRHALEIRENAFGPDASATVTSVNNLGLLLLRQGQLADARPYLERAVAIDERLLGLDHPDTATSLNNLGLLHREFGNLDIARSLYERSLAIREKALGPSHPETANSLINLGMLLRAQREFSAARPYLERALSIRETALGPNHPDTAYSLNSLGMLLRDQRDLSGARPLLERALSIREQVLGSDHLDTATSHNNLGLLLRDQGDLGEARLHIEHAVAINEKGAGPNHPSTANTLVSLGLVLRDLGTKRAARLCFERALAIRGRVLGPDHPATIDVRRTLTDLDGPFES